MFRSVYSTSWAKMRFHSTSTSRLTHPTLLLWWPAQFPHCCHPQSSSSAHMITIQGTGRAGCRRAMWGWVLCPGGGPGELFRWFGGSSWTTGCPIGQQSRPSNPFPGRYWQGRQAVFCKLECESSSAGNLFKIIFRASAGTADLPPIYLQKSCSLAGLIFTVSRLAED